MANRKDTLACVILPHMRLQDVNVESNVFVSGLPSMTAFTGYAHAFERWLHSQDWELQVEGVAVMLHTVEQHSGHPKCPDALHGTKLKDIQNPRIIEEIKADLQITLLFNLVGDIDDEELTEQLEGDFDLDDELCQKIKHWVYHTPCCGGHCQSIAEITALALTNNDDKPKAQKCLQQIQFRQQGWFIIPREDLIHQAQAQGLDSLDAVFNALRLRAIDEDYQRDQRGWIIPLAVGYQAIESPQQRLATRKNNPHVYAEALTGLGELIHAGSALFDPEFDLQAFLWRHRVDPEHNLYYVTTETEYLRDSHHG